MKFSEFKYGITDLESFKKQLEKELSLINTNQDLETEIKAIYRIFDIFDEGDTLGTLVSIRNSVDTKDCSWKVAFIHLSNDFS